MRRVLGSFLILWCIGNAPALAAATEATTRDGKVVLLFPDGTWRYKDKEPEKKPAGSFTKPENATEVKKSDKGFLEIWYDPDKWVTPGGLENSAAEFNFKHKSGDAYALVVIERLTMPLQNLRDVGVNNAKKVAPDAKVVMEEERTVNGQKVIAVQIEATTNGIPAKYFNYYWSGKAGCVQLITFTGQNLFEEYGTDMQDLLNGLTVTKKD
jgi:hypothetical protein